MVGWLTASADAAVAVPCGALGMTKRLTSTDAVLPCDASDGGPLLVPGGPAMHIPMAPFYGDLKHCSFGAGSPGQAWHTGLW